MKPFFTSTFLCISLICLLLCTLSTLADYCQCGAQCSAYTDGTKCTRCCTHSVKRRALNFDQLPQEQRQIYEENRVVVDPILARILAFLRTNDV
ncbi:unnamed protein product [Caenorhabditis angaria]|uniref:Secreted protein n=1 Tax=Caenorhabditis angaria TaxID=860376 RepID=A0A9P1MXK9_9PELO|nr:unnamed protein product [Caenorhabditis angaria]